MLGIGQPELIIIIFILLLFFGPGNLPKLSKTLADSLRSLREGFTGGKNDKSLRDITNEVTSSARDIKHSFIGMSDPQPAPTNGQAQPQSPNNSSQPEVVKE